MKKLIKFTSVKVAHSLECLSKAVKKFRNPQRGGRRPQISVGFVVYRLSGSPRDLTSPMVASPNKGQKTRFVSPYWLADKVGNHTLLNRSQGLTCTPVNEPHLYYTDTSLTAKVSSSQLSLGGRGLTYFLLTYLPSVAFSCNSNF